MARICALRLARWCAPWLNPLQFGFRAGSGVDDTQQLSRRLLEELAQSQRANTYFFRLFDLEKTYPKVVRHGLSRVLEVKGFPPLHYMFCKLSMILPLVMFGSMVLNHLHSHRVVGYRRAVLPHRYYSVFTTLRLCDHGGIS